MKHINISLIYLLWVLFFALSSATLSAQQTNKFQLLDQTTNDPIIGATFHYGTQSGISNQEGFIEFRFTSGNKMTISHIVYGKKVLNDTALNALIDNKILFWKESIVNLFPVTIMMKWRLLS